MKNLVFIFVFTLCVSFIANGQVPEVCPVITVTGPTGLTQRGEPMLFRAEIGKSGDQKLFKYFWTISQGIIVNGQGTNQIYAESLEAGSNVTATVTVEGLSPKCVNTASETASYAPFVCGLSMAADMYDGKIPWSDEKLRLDNLLFMLYNNSGSRLFIYLDIEPNETAQEAKKHVAKIAKHLKSTDKDLNLRRLYFAIRKSDVHRTTAHMVPESAELPECKDDCTLIRAETLRF